MQYLLGLDVGSSSVKASLVDIHTGALAATTFYPESEAPIKALQAGWAEQSPDMWWQNAKLAMQKVMHDVSATGADIKAIGISYQMHGLVCIDRDRNVLRPSIIWCDSRAVPYGNRAFEALGADWCLQHLLNSPGNFTAAKLAWVRRTSLTCMAKYIR
jgi:xylulokinase